MGKLTSDYTGSLLEEIIIQRRIELWGIYRRIYDIRHLNQDSNELHRLMTDAVC